QSQKHINTWVSKKTEGKIRDLLPGNSIDEQTRLVLVNAVYFKGRWNEEFNKTCTMEMPFKISQVGEASKSPGSLMKEWNGKISCIMDALSEANGSFALHLLRVLCQDNPSHNVFYSPVSVSSALAMVFLGAKGNTAAEMAQVLELPYAGKELSMLIVLPDDGVDLSSVEKNLTFEKFIAWTKPDCMKHTEVEVLLPRFKLEEDYDMGSVLQCLGIIDAFQEGKADFSAMSAKRDLCLSKFVHKAFVEVNEEGTEAAAASATVVVECCFVDGPRFCADHPFLFFIRHNKADCILFCGRFCSP
ncbi:PREDICTED: serpin B9-like, partial [Hipposideros armiger]|uniref:Serpin B9-like n=1 Tax=Hipposideros armiger TaxID=186990 RepID=A0A8B7T5I2_HIPAR